jgi:hypothetical protein
VVLVLAGFGFLWMTFQSGRWSWIATLGQHSLLVYWLHIELVYGRWLGFWKETLSLGQTMVLSGIAIAFMVALAEMKGRYDRGEWPALRLAIGKYWPIGV